MNDLFLSPLEAQTQAQSFREASEAVRTYQRGISSRQSVYNCGRARIRGVSHGVVERVIYGDHSHTRIRGLQVCDSWFCFVCSHRKREVVRDELERLLVAAAAKGFEIDYGVLTLDNAGWIETPRFFSREQEFIRSEEYKNGVRGTEGWKPGARARFFEAHPELPDDSWEQWGGTQKIAARAEAMRRLLSGAAWTKVKNTYGVVGLIHLNEDTVEAVESLGYFNFGRTRLHATKNVIVIRDAAAAEGRREDFYAALVARWVKVCADLGWKASADHQKFQWLSTDDPATIPTIAHYVTKQLALFATPSNRTVRDDGTTSFTPWGVLELAARAASGGQENPSAVVWWRNYENAYKGRPFVSKTPGLLKRLGIPAAEVAKPRIEPTSVELVDVLPFDTLVAVSENPSVHAALLNAVENDPTNTAAHRLIKDVERLAQRVAA